MALHAVKNWLSPSADPPIWTGTAPAAAAVVKGSPVYRNVSDGRITAVATNGTKIIGFALEAAAAGETFKYTPCLPGIWFKIDFDGTYAATKLGTYVEITVTSGVPTANLDESSNDILKLEEVIDNDSTASKYTAWFSAAHSADQTTIETA